MNRRSTIADFLALNRNVVFLLLAIVLIGAGEETWMRFLPKYLDVLGASAFIIGLFDAIKTLLGAVYAYPGGVVVDRWGHRRAFVSFTLISITGYLFVLFTRHWLGVIIGMFFFLAWSSFSLPATFSLIAGSLPSHKHTMGIGIQSLIKRVPILIGPVAGGLLIDHFGFTRGVRIGVICAIVLAACAMALQWHIRVPAEKERREPGNFWSVVQGFSPRLSHLLISDILIRFCERLPFAWVVIYAMDYVGASATQVGILIAVEMITAMLIYIPTAHLADRFGKEPFVIATFVFFTLFPASLLLARSFPLLAVAFAIRGLKEFGDPARKALLLAYSPADRRGRTVGAYYLIRDTIVTIGSFLGAALWKISPQANLWTATALGLTGTLFYVAYLSKARR
ncbi:MAG TPA: MFS transporter [Acidobacteriota bacterium]|jgi:MFS family permease